MQEISNSLRQRLGARPQPQTHPDPDTLTAYVEQVLPAAERGRVIDHLAECSDCREVVALSLPELRPQQPVLQVPERSRWWIPAYRWGALAATIAIAATLIVEKPWQRPASTTQTFQDKAVATAEKSQPAGSAVSQATPVSPTPLEPPASMQPNKAPSGQRLISRDDDFAPHARMARKSEHRLLAPAPPPPPQPSVDAASSYVSGGVSAPTVNGAPAPQRVTSAPTMSRATTTESDSAARQTLKEE